MLSTKPPHTCYTLPDIYRHFNSDRIFGPYLIWQSSRHVMMQAVLVAATNIHQLGTLDAQAIGHN